MNREDRRATKREDKKNLAAASGGGAGVPMAPASSGSSEMGPRKRTGPLQFLKEVRSELRKVAWPTRKEVGSYTVVVLTVTVVLTAIVAAMDWVIRNATLNVFG